MLNGLGVSCWHRHLPVTVLPEPLETQLEWFECSSKKLFHISRCFLRPFSCSAVGSIRQCSPPAQVQLPSLVKLWWCKDLEHVPSCWLTKPFLLAVCELCDRTLCKLPNIFSAFLIFPGCVNERWPNRELWLVFFAWLTTASHGYLLFQFHSDQQKCALFQERKVCHNYSDFSTATNHLI